MIDPNHEESREENTKEETEEESKEVFIEPVEIDRNDRYSTRRDNTIIGIAKEDDFFLSNIQ